jgi:hypothetical protein
MGALDSSISGGLTSVPEEECTIVAVVDAPNTDEGTLCVPAVDGKV